MVSRLAVRVMLVAACVLVSAAVPGADEGWTVYVMPWSPTEPAGGFQFGALPSCVDGWDCENPWKYFRPGVAAEFYRPEWADPEYNFGPFFKQDLRSPILPGESKTWDDIYLWAQNYTPPGGTAVVWIDPYTPPPPGYTGLLVLDYVPQSAGWNGPMQFDLDFVRGNFIALPVPTVTDPLEGVRMHITIYAIPEPASLSVLALAAGLGAGAIRRRRWAA